MPSASVPFEGVKIFLIQASPDLPPEAWAFTGAILLALGIAAAIDARTGIVPDPLIFLGLFSVAALHGIFVSWDVAALHLRQAIAAGVLIWAINEAWFRAFKHDALGMGDAKWTMLAVAHFGIESSIVAWGVSSVIATIFIGLFRVFNHQISQVRFAPFLFVGLGVALHIGPVW
jgi:prepilin signal peptidase PulO-like enzyme (type II secretory pathway)